MDTSNRNQIFADILANDKYLDCHSQRRRMLKAFDAQDNGLLLSLEGEHLRVRWQGVAPSPDLLASIKTHK